MPPHPPPPPPPASSSLGGFSIREYTSQTRAADVTKCWPFGECADGGASPYSDFLPPIRVVKFRWWLDVLAASRSRDQINDAIPLLVPVIPRRSCYVSGGDGDSDNCRRRKKKKKTMTKKKKKKRERSIVEIFAVSPRVAVRTKKLARTKRRRVEAGVKSVDPITSASARVSKAKEVLEIDKGSDIELKQKIPSDTVTRDSLAETCLGDSFDFLQSKEKRASKSVCSQKRSKGGQLSPDFDAKRPKQANPENPVRGILKRRLQFDSEQGSEVGRVDFQSTVISRDMGEKRVKFTISSSDGDGRSDERNMGQLSVSVDDSNDAETVAQAVVVSDDCPESRRNRSDCKAVIDAGGSPHSSVEGNLGQHVEPSTIQQESSNGLKESRVCSQISTVLDKPLPAFDKRTTVTFRSPSGVDCSKHFYEVARPISARANVSVERNTLRYDCRPVVPWPIYSPYQSAATRAVSELPRAYFAPETGCTNRGVRSLLSGSTLASASSCSSPYPPSYFMHPPNPRGRLYAFQTDGLTGKSLPDLPLNSYGEFLQDHSNGDSLFRQAKLSENFRLRMTVSGGASDQLDSFRMLGLGEKNPFNLHVARSHPWTEVTRCQHEPAETSDWRLRGKGVAYMGRCRDRVLPRLAPLTMRLMGKDVSVSNHSQDVNGSGGSIWIDKGLMMEHCPLTDNKAFLPGMHQFTQQWITQTDSAISKEADCRCRNPYFARPNGDASAGRYLTDELHVSGHLSLASFPDFCSPGPPKCHHMCRRPVGLSNMQNTFPWSCGPLHSPEGNEYSQQAQLPIISSGLAPFPPTCPFEHGQASSFQSSNVIPPWISVAPVSEWGKTPSFYYQPHVDARHNYESVPASYTSGRVNSLIRGETSSVLSSPQPPFMPVLPRIGLNPPQRPSFNSHYDANTRDGVEWNPTEFSGCAPIRNSGQKPAALLVDPEKHLHLQPPCAGPLYAEATPASVEIDFCKGTGNWGNFVGPQIENLRLRTSHVISNSAKHVKGKEVAHLGSSKLTAGAKHILKPSLDTSKASSIPVHSTIPLAGVTGYGMVPECEPKSTKIFKL